MAMYYCQTCDNNIDLDYDVEHYEQCPYKETDDEDIEELNLLAKQTCEQEITIQTAQTSQRNE